MLYCPLIYYLYLSLIYLIYLSLIYYLYLYPFPNSKLPYSIPLDKLLLYEIFLPHSKKSYPSLFINYFPLCIVLIDSWLGGNGGCFIPCIDDDLSLTFFKKLLVSLNDSFIDPLSLFNYLKDPFSFLIYSFLKFLLLLF